MRTSTHDTADIFFAGVIALLMGLWFGFILARAYQEPVDPGLLNEWKCDKSMTMIVDIPGDGVGPVEGYHCERVKKDKE